MKRITILLSFAVVASMILFTSCKKDKDVTPGESHKDFTAAQHQESLAKASNDAIAQMEVLQNSKAADAAMNFENFMSLDDIFAEEGGTKAKSILKGIENFVENPSDKSALLKSLNQEEPFRFPFDELAGKYTWNSVTQTWDKTTSTQIIFEFPSTETGTVNNAILTFVSYTDQQFTMGTDVVYLPTGASINLTIDGIKELEFTYTATYKTGGIPETVDVTLFVNPFNFTASLENTNTKISGDLAWTLENNNILSFGSAWNGDFSTLSFGENGTDPTDVATSASAYAQIFDARLEVTANVTELKKYDDPTTEQVNANTTILLKWANDNVKIADGAFYEKENGDVSVMLTFADGTTTDAEVFFDSIMQEFEDFFNSLDNDQSL